MMISFSFSFLICALCSKIILTYINIFLMLRKFRAI